MNHYTFPHPPNPNPTTDSDSGSDDDLCRPHSSNIISPSRKRRRGIIGKKIMISKIKK